MCAFFRSFLSVDNLKYFRTVFDVDIGDGEPIRKLPYNRSGMFDLFHLVYHFVFGIGMAFDYDFFFVIKLMLIAVSLRLLLFVV